jgi:hypothetical protein
MQGPKASSGAIEHHPATGTNITNIDGKEDRRSALRRCAQHASPHVKEDGCESTRLQLATRDQEATDSGTTLPIISSSYGQVPAAVQTPWRVPWLMMLLQKGARATEGEETIASGNKQQTMIVCMHKNRPQPSHRQRQDKIDRYSSRRNSCRTASTARSKLRIRWTQSSIRTPTRLPHSCHAAMACCHTLLNTPDGVLCAARHERKLQVQMAHRKHQRYT